MSSQLAAPPDSPVHVGYERLERFGRFCSRLVLEDGRPFELEPFQWRMLVDYFVSGSIETLVLISKKNGKTTLLARARPVPPARRRSTRSA